MKVNSPQGMLLLSKRGKYSMIIFLLKNLLWLGPLSMFLTLSTLAEPEDMNCYPIEMNSPARESDQENEVEVWCYQRLASPEGAVFIFNADEDEIHDELSFILESDGRMTHSSLLNGKLTVHRLWSHHFNPFSVPLEEPKHLQAIELDPEKSLRLLNSMNRSLRFYQQTPPQMADLTVSDGVKSVSVPESAKPWRGYWWPRKGHPLSSGPNSPLAKYDRYVEARTDSNPRAQAWENSNHGYRGVGWEGHCNGWVASAVLRPEPNRPQHDRLSGVTFSVSDQKGLLAVMDYCTSTAFFGDRYRGGGDDIKDIYPAEFHKVLVYYIEELGKPVSLDYKRGSSVDNHLISGYRMEIDSIGDNVYSVVARLTVHKYDTFRTNTPGIAPTYTRTYRYTLTTDNSGNPSGGSWRSGNPDFLWVPLRVRDCNNNNPKVTENWIQSIIFE